MKKLLCMILAIAALLTLAACSGEKNTQKPTFSIEKEEEYEEYEEYEETPEAYLESDTTEAVEEATESEPTDEEMNMLVEYVQLVAELNQATHYTHYQEACAKLLEMESVEKWVGTQYATSAYDTVEYRDEDLAEAFNKQTDWDRQGVLARLAIVEDAYLGHTVTTQDNLGNTQAGNLQRTRSYYADGSVRYLDFSLGMNYYLWNDWEDLSNNDIYSSRFDVFRVFTEGEREYDEAGRVVNVKDKNGNTVKVLYEVGYNANGTISKIVKKENTKETEYTFAYAEEDRVVTVSGFSEVITYTYDQNGRLVKEEMAEYTRYADETMEEADLSKLGRMEYTYDQNGTLISAAYTQQLYASYGSERYMSSETVDAYTVTCDDQGRVTQVVKLPGDTTNYDNKGNGKTKVAEYAQITYDLVYGDFYIYTPAE